MAENDRWAQSSETIIFNLIIFPLKPSSDSTNFFHRIPHALSLTHTDARTRDRSPLVPIDGCKVVSILDYATSEIVTTIEPRWPNALFEMTQKTFKLYISPRERMASFATNVLLVVERNVLLEQILRRRKGQIQDARIADRGPITINHRLVTRRIYLLQSETLLCQPDESILLDGNKEDISLDALRLLYVITCDREVHI